MNSENTDISKLRKELSRRWLYAVIDYQVKADYINHKISHEECLFNSGERNFPFFTLHVGEIV